MRLTEIGTQTWVRLVSIDEKGATEGKLAQYGLFPGDLARVLRIAPLGGPLLIEAGGREIALGRTLAQLIIVELA